MHLLPKNNRKIASRHCKETYLSLGETIEKYRTTASLQAEIMVLMTCQELQYNEEGVWDRNGVSSLWREIPEYLGPA